MASPASNQFSEDCQSMAATRTIPSSHVTGHRLIWCHEHCHNTENRGRRQEIRQSMSEIGWSCTFHKKVLQFSKWVEELPWNSSQQYVLVLGWREAQPCLRLLGQQHRSKLPLIAVVVCNNKKQQARAATFVQSLPSALSMVHTCVQDDIPDWLFHGNIRRCFAVAQESSAAKYSSTTSTTASTNSGSGSELDSQSWDHVLRFNHAVAAPTPAARPPAVAPAPAPLGLACPPGFEDADAPAAILSKTSFAGEALALLAASTLGQPLSLKSRSFDLAAALEILNADHTNMPHYQQEVDTSSFLKQPVQAQLWHL